MRKYFFAPKSFDNQSCTHYNTYKEVYAMRTNVVLDDALVREAFKHAEVKTKKDLISLALREFIERKSRRDLTELRGKVSFRKGYDYKKLRKGV